MSQEIMEKIQNANLSLEAFVLKSETRADATVLPCLLDNTNNKEVTGNWVLWFTAVGPALRSTGLERRLGRSEY